MVPDFTTTTAITKTTSLSKAPSQPRRAYVTFLPGNGDHVNGVVGLAKGLRKAMSKYPLVVAILLDVPEEHRKILVDQGCIVREIEPVYPPENSTQFAMAYYVVNYSKLRIWEGLKPWRYTEKEQNMEREDNQDADPKMVLDYNNCFSPAAAKVEAEVEVVAEAVALPGGSLGGSWPLLH